MWFYYEGKSIRYFCWFTRIENRKKRRKSIYCAFSKATQTFELLFLRVQEFFVVYFKGESKILLIWMLHSYSMWKMGIEIFNRPYTQLRDTFFYYSQYTNITKYYNNLIHSHKVYLQSVKAQNIIIINPLSWFSVVSCLCVFDFMLLLFFPLPKWKYCYTFFFIRNIWTMLCVWY